MGILFVVLILFGSLANSLSRDKCNFEKIYTEVLRFCRGSDYSGCSGDLNNFSVFLKSFLNSTEIFCNLRRIKGYCKSCSINASSWNDLVASEGNVTNTTGNSTTANENKTTTTEAPAAAK